MRQKNSKFEDAAIQIFVQPYASPTNIHAMYSYARA